MSAAASGAVAAGGPAADPGVRRLVRIAFTASGAVFAFLIYQLYLREPGAAPPAWTVSIPAVNAGFNAATTTLVCLGVLAIRAGRRSLHIGLQLGALLTTSLFLLGYLTYHHFHGDTPYPGTGFLRPIYFTVLGTHILASMAGLPLLVTSVLFAATRRFAHHRRWARITVPVWLYASITGLAVYGLLYG